MAFFGLTTLGPTNPVAEATKLSQAYCFHEIPEEAYVEVFNRNVLGDCDIAVTLQVTGNDHIVRAKLGDLLSQLLGRQPRKAELDAWFTHLDFDRGAVMGIEEYVKGVRKLQEFSAGQEKPSQYSSYDTQRTDWLRHTRIGYENQQTLKAPMTTAQEVGWHAAKPAPPSNEPKRTIRSTDVSQKEGRNAMSYYGYYVCN